MNLYRIMSDIRAGAGCTGAKHGAPGIVTLWVRAASDTMAIAQAKRILADRPYESIGELKVYLEEAPRDSLSIGNEASPMEASPDDPMVQGYQAIRQRALLRADGLFEVWLPETDLRASAARKGLAA